MRDRSNELVLKRQKGQVFQVAASREKKKGSGNPFESSFPGESALQNCGRYVTHWAACFCSVQTIGIRPSVAQLDRTYER